MTAPSVLSPEQAEQFHRDGFLLLPSFYDLVSEIDPIRRSIHAIIQIVAADNGVAVPSRPFMPEEFDSGYRELIRKERRLGGVVYDAVKQIPAFIRLVALPRHEQIVAQLRNTDLVGIAGGGYGIRIDNPNEDKFRALWHQEYPAQLRSLDGIVFWSPLRALTPELGPVQICPGTHRRGPMRVHTTDPRNPNKSGAYALVLENEAEVEGLPRIAPLTKPGDLLLLDFLTLHQSGENRSQYSRWSMQLRYFNFREATGRRIGWRGSYSAGVDFRAIHPELAVDECSPFSKHAGRSNDSASR